MPYIKTIDESEATGPTKEIYKTEGMWSGQGDGVRS